MTTGITINKWQNGANIIEKQKFDSNDISYELAYKGKLPVEEIISTKYTSEYVPVHSTHVDNTSKLNSIYYGDNLDVLRFLLQERNLRGKVNLIYIDPPYGTNSVFHSRSNRDSYKDNLIGSHYLEFIRQRLILLRELLGDKGSIYIHLDNNMVFQIKIIMDEVFGTKNFRGFITRKKCSNKNYTRNTYGNIADYILFYSKTDAYIWNRPTEPWTDEKILKEYPNIEPATNRRFKKVPIHAPGVRNGETGKPWRGMSPPPGKHWQFTPAKLDEFDKKGEIYWSPNGNPRRKVYLDTSDGISVQDIWLEFQDSLNQNIKITGYPTEKNPFLLERIIKASSNEDDIVLDCFAGSGTTLDVADQLKRQWIGIDNSSEAIDHILKRFVQGLEEMGDYVSKRTEVTPIAQAALFDSLATVDVARRDSHSFTFFSDKEHLKEAEQLSVKWFGQVSAISEPQHAYCAGLRSAINFLKLKDKRLKGLIEQIGECQLRPRQSKFEYLVEAIISQQLSLSASLTIIKRLKAHYDDDLSAEKFLETPEATLNKLGVSRRKITYILDLCEKISSRKLSFSSLDDLDNDEIVNELTKVKGIGVWTAKMFLIFVLGRLNVFPKEDKAFINRVKNVYRLNENDSFERALEGIQKKWEPYETVGAWYIWKSIGTRETKYQQ
jgi:adenine-specific DNA-methyltransferase